MLTPIDLFTPITNLDDTHQVKSKADSIIFQLSNAGFINQKQCKYLTDFTPRCPLFYGLPKLHKKDCPLRPIVSQINGPTSRLNELVDKYLLTAEQNIPYLLQDTTAYLQLIDRNKNNGTDCFLVTMDVTSLYTNIPHEEGADWVSGHYEDTLFDWYRHSASFTPVDRQTMYELITFILKNCTFSFNEQFYSQLYGTTMGAKFSVKFANIYMFKWLSRFVDAYVGPKPDFIARLIDDCFFLWYHTEETLIQFIEYLNSCHTSIKFEVNYSKSSVTFLDTVTYIENGKILTTIYTKPTDRKQYLYFTSNHPSHVKKAIPYSQALRYRRIIVDDQLLETELTTLSKRFTLRGYPIALLDSSIGRARLMSRDNILKYKDHNMKRDSFDRFLNGRSFLPLIITYHSLFDQQNLRQYFTDSWQATILNDDCLKAVFENELPQIVFKKGRTLANVLTSTKLNVDVHLDETDLKNIQILHELEDESNSTGFYSASEPPRCTDMVTPCRHKLCGCCRHLLVTSNFHNTEKTTFFDITSHFNCNSKDLIYVISCTKCNKLYVGQTSKMLKERLNNHRSDIRLNKNTAVSKHFNDIGHDLLNLKITPIFSLIGLSLHERLTIEYSYMKSLNTFYPTGLNYYPLT